MREFNLIYFHKKTGQKFAGKRATPTDYVLVDEDTGKRLELTHYLLHRDFDSDPANKSFRNIGLPISGRKIKRVKTDSKAFQDYLRGVQ